MLVPVYDPFSSGVVWLSSSFPRRSLLSTLFPYTTLFRSLASFSLSLPTASRKFSNSLASTGNRPQNTTGCAGLKPASGADAGFFSRSEEHTSELQSQLHLVCRLLLEKKKDAGACL